MTGVVIKRLSIFLFFIVATLPAFLFSGEERRFDQFVRYYREKNYAMVKNMAKELIELPQYRYHVKLVLSEVYFQENDFYYSEQLLKELLEEYPDKSAEINKRLEKVEKEKQFISSKSSEVNRRFVVFWKEGVEKNESIIKEVTNYLDEAYVQAGRFFEWYPEYTIQIILYYGSEYSDYTVFPVWSQGGYDGKLRIMINANIPSKVLKEIIFHEYTHLVVQGITKGNIPLWFNEAVAQYFSRKYGLGENIILEDFEYSYDSFPKNWTRLADKDIKKLYKDSLMLLISIIQKSDELFINSMLNALGKGESFEAAANSILSVYGITLKDFAKGDRQK